MSDGSDYVHRERVAAQYTTSVQYKAYLRLLVMLNFALVTLTFPLAFKCSSFFDQALCGRILSLSGGWSIVCIVAGISAVISCKSNSLKLISVFKFCHMLIGPAFVAFSIVIGTFNSFFEKDSMAISACVLFMFHVIAIQIHFVCWYIAKILEECWDVSRKTRDKHE